ncbi:MAG: Alpha-L-fucosidase [Firmicutes bacterium ADurb.Bin300]|nr:MAG: Alpha-L-fucosidase [Firmicutes bacterium ADurb.Bin300]
MKKPYEIAALVKPSERQLLWQETEYYGLIHFGMPTIVNQEWSDGTVKPENFAPELFSASEWVKLFKDAGMKGLVLTVKHHDGFCLWNSRFTDYCVKNAINWEVENRDIVKLISDECEKQGLKFGIYITPLDRHETTYGTGDAYNTYFKSLLSELLTNYGDIFYVRFDGTVEPVKGGYEQQYDWEGYYELVRRLQPNAVIALCGPDIRWNGNEWGVCRKNEWSVIPARYSIYKAINNSKGQEKLSKKSATMELDLGSRKAIKKDEEFIWYPAEVCISIRDGWYYHKSDEYTAKTKDKLLKLYYNTVGSNYCFMLNVPPMKNGKFADMESQIIRAFGYDLNKMFAYTVSSIGEIKASSELSSEYSAENLFSSDKSKTWKPAQGDKEPVLTITLSEIDMFDKLVLMEHIRNGQHVEEFTVYADYGSGKWKKLEKCGIIGYKKIVKVRPVEVKAIKVVFNSFRPGLEMESVLMF